MVDDSNEPTSDLTSPSSQPVGSDAILPTPKEPDPEPIAPVAPTPEVVKEPMINIEEMLGNSSTIVPSGSPSLIVPNHPTPSSADIKPKKKNMAGIIVGLMLFLGVVATGAYFVAKPDSLADTRSEAAKEKNAATLRNEEQQRLNKKAREEKEAEEEPVSETQKAINKCIHDGGSTNDCYSDAGVKKPTYNEQKALDAGYQLINKNEAGCRADGKFWCGDFCMDSQTKTCDQIRIDRGETINTGSVQCDDDGTAKDGVYRSGKNLNSDGTAANPESIGAIKDSSGKILSVLDQVNAQCAALKGKIDTSNTNNKTDIKISDIGFGKDKYICKEGVKGEGNIVYKGGQCTALNGKKFTGNEKGCFCGTVQVDTGSGHESYTSTCGCDKDEPASELTSNSVIEPTPTTATTTSPICTNIKVYKEAVQITPSTLLPSDDVTIAVVGTGNPTQARFRVNGEQITGDTDADPNWTISTTKNTSGEYFVSYTIPIGVTSFLFEGETFAAGEWH